MNITEERQVQGFEIPVAHQKLLADSGLCDKYDPYDFAEKRDWMEDGKDRTVLTLPVRAQTLWFKSVYPEGRIEPTYRGKEDLSYIVEVRLYKDGNPDTLPMSVGIAVTSPGEKRPEGETQISFAISIASNMAFTNAGFNIPSLWMSLEDYAGDTPLEITKPEKESEIVPKRTRKKKDATEGIAPEVIPAPSLAEVTQVPVMSDKTPELDTALNATHTTENVDEDEYGKYDCDLTGADITELAKVIIREGGQNTPAGKIVASRSPINMWLRKYENDEGAAKCRRAQAKIVCYLNRVVAEDEANLDLVKKAVGI